MCEFFSTRGDVCAVNAPEAVLRGLAPDGGLYTVKQAPAIDPAALKDADFRTISKKILGAYLSGYTQDEIDACVEAAYKDKFDAEEICPVKQVGDAYMLELFHGPTSAFKDVALSVLPQLMSRAMKKTDKKEEIMILTATSGDTGSAALYGFKNVDGIRILVFYPEHGISPIQKAQMTTMDGSNVGVCAVSANFDAAQTGVKRVFLEMPAEFLRRNAISLSSANSINFGRLAPQIVYYYSAYLDLVRSGAVKMGDKVNFCVPTGNFGDILAGYFAKKSGLPIGKLICASNANKVLTDFLNTGIYDKNRDFMVTTSPSMDILVSSNLERLLYLESGCDAELVRSCMESLKACGKYEMPSCIMDRIRENFAAECADDAMASDAIKRIFEKEGYLMDPHTAVAWRVMEDYRARTGDCGPCVVLSTASPYKFPATVLNALKGASPEDAGEQLALMEKISGMKAPVALDGVLNRETRFGDVIAPEDMMAYVQGKAAKRA